MSKSYDFVEFLTPVKFHTGEGEGYTGKLKLEIKTLTPLYIGSGYEESDGKGGIFKAFQRFNDYYIIPGSSLKGVIRTVSQAVSYSCVEVQKSKDLPLPLQNIKDCKCIVCSIFGRMKQKGKIMVRDFIAEKNNEGKLEIIPIPIQMEPQINKKEVYYKEGRLKGIKFYRHGDYRIVEKPVIPVEVAPTGTIFKGEIVFEGIDKKQLQLLCYSLGLDNSFQLKVGGNKAGYFGSCEVISVELKLKEQKINLDPRKEASRYGEGDEKIRKNQNKLVDILSFEKRIKSL